MLVAILTPAGSDLARRLVGALLLVPEPEREGVVARFERELVKAYTPDDARREPPEVHVVHPPRERDGYTEQEIVTYGALTPGAKASPAVGRATSR